MNKVKFFLAVILAAVLLPGCGAGDDSAQTELKKTVSMESGEIGEPETKDVTFYGVNDLQISAAMMIAENQGYFKEEGLNVKSCF